MLQMPTPIATAPPATQAGRSRPSASDPPGVTVGVRDGRRHLEHALRGDAGRVHLPVPVPTSPSSSSCSVIVAVRCVRPRLPRGEPADTDPWRNPGGERAMDGSRHRRHALHRHGRDAVAAEQHYDARLVGASIAIAVVASFIGLWLAYRCARMRAVAPASAASSAPAMGGAIAGMGAPAWPRARPLHRGREPATRPRWTGRHT